MAKKSRQAPMSFGGHAGSTYWIVKRSRRPDMMLKNKVAVIYGAGGDIGAAVARAFAREGAKVFLTGRKLAPVKSVAKDIVAAGGSAEAAEVDALDEQAVNKHLQSLINKASRVDIPIKADKITNTNVAGLSLTEGRSDPYHQQTTV